MQKNTRFIGEITFYKIERRLFILQLKVLKNKQKTRDIKPLKYKIIKAGKKQCFPSV